MKSLYQYILEATAETKPFYEVIKDPKKRRRFAVAEFYTNNKLEPFKILTKAGQNKFWDKFIVWCRNLNGNTPKTFGFENLDDMVSYVMHAIETNSPDTKSSGFKEMGELFKKSYDLKKSEYKEEYEKFVKKYGPGRDIDVNYEGDDLTSDEFEHAVVCRAMYGETPVRLYGYQGKWTDDTNRIKMQYWYDTGCKYYDVRPILLKNWKNLPNDKKDATA